MTWVHPQVPIVTIFPTAIVQGQTTKVVLDSNDGSLFYCERFDGADASVCHGPISDLRSSKFLARGSNENYVAAK
ncbi:hypothetical protein BDN67DRAFT_970948 [Paxillus ammoniavirescens]|nr:hypothetical protein BDN67DRAFT_970948 [Paxillus ammoniavirescens]